MKHSDKITIEQAIDTARKCPNATIEQIVEFCLASEEYRNLNNPREGKAARRYSRALHSMPEAIIASFSVTL